MGCKELRQVAHRFERTGEWEQAKEAYSRLFWHGAGEGNLAAVADALRGDSRVRQQQGRFEEAIELAELSWFVAERGGLPRETARAINAVAMVYHLQRDWPRARALYNDALERALELGDDVLVGEACVNLGVLANIRGELREARVRYLESIGSSVRSGNKANAMMAYNNLGIVCSDLQEWMEAELYLTRGIEIAERFGDSPLLAKLFVNRVKPLIEVGELGQALASIGRAEALAGETGDPVVLSEAARYRGILLCLEGDTVRARAHLDRALAIAAQSQLGLERAEALCELAQLDRKEGRTDAAVAALREARELYLSLGAERDAARAAEMLEEWERTPDPVPLRIRLSER